MSPWLTAIFLLLSFLIMALDARDASTGNLVVRTWVQTAADFVQSPVTTVTSSVANYFISISELRTAQDENSQLKQRVQELEVEIKQKDDLSAENQRLRALLQLKEQSKYKVLNARIIGRDPSVWFNAAVIDRGSLDGVALNMPVVTDGGLIGRITAVGPLTSQIDLITYNKSGVGAIVGEIGDSNAIGVVTGTGKNEVLEMRYVPGTIEVAEGQAVYTTGQDGIYPAGLKIGEIFNVISGSATTSHVIQIRPAARLSSMQEVGILLYEAVAKPEFEHKLPNATQKKNP